MDLQPNPRGGLTSKGTDENHRVKCKDPSKKTKFQSTANHKNTNKHTPAKRHLLSNDNSKPLGNRKRKGSKKQKQSIGKNEQLAEIVPSERRSLKSVTKLSLPQRGPPADLLRRLCQVWAIQIGDGFNRVDTKNNITLATNDSQKFGFLYLDTLMREAIGSAPRAPPTTMGFGSADERSAAELACTPLGAATPRAWNPQKRSMSDRNPPTDRIVFSTKPDGRHANLLLVHNGIFLRDPRATHNACFKQVTDRELHTAMHEIGVRLAVVVVEVVHVCNGLSLSPNINTKELRESLLNSNNKYSPALTGVQQKRALVWDTLLMCFDLKFLQLDDQTTGLFRAKWRTPKEINILRRSKSPTSDPSSYVYDLPAWERLSLLHTLCQAVDVRLEENKKTNEEQVGYLGVKDQMPSIKTHLVFKEVSPMSWGTGSDGDHQKTPVQQACSNIFRLVKPTDKHGERLRIDDSEEYLSGVVPLPVEGYFGEPALVFMRRWENLASCAASHRTDQATQEAWNEILRSPPCFVKVVTLPAGRGRFANDRTVLLCLDGFTLLNLDATGRVGTSKIPDTHRHLIPYNADSARLWSEVKLKMTPLETSDLHAEFNSLSNTVILSSKAPGEKNSAAALKTEAILSAAPEKMSGAVSIHPDLLEVVKKHPGVVLECCFDPVNNTWVPVDTRLEKESPNFFVVVEDVRAVVTMKLQSTFELFGVTPTDSVAQLSRSSPVHPSRSRNITTSSTTRTLSSTSQQATTRNTSTFSTSKNDKHTRCSPPNHLLYAPQRDGPTSVYPPHAPKSYLDINPFQPSERGLPPLTNNSSLTFSEKLILGPSTGMPLPQPAQTTSSPQYAPRRSEVGTNSLLEPPSVNELDNSNVFSGGGFGNFNEQDLSSLLDTLLKSRAQTFKSGI
jgi:hypothetical protein